MSAIGVDHAVWVVGTVIPSASGPPGRRTGAARWSPCNSLRLEDYRHSDKEIIMIVVSTPLGSLWRARGATQPRRDCRVRASLQYEPRLSSGRRQGKKQHPSLSHLICRAFDTQACAANAYAQAGQAHCSVQISLLPLAQVLGYARCSCAHFLAPVGTDLRRCTHT